MAVAEAVAVAVAVAVVAVRTPVGDATGPRQHTMVCGYCALDAIRAVVAAALLAVQCV